MNLPTPVVRDRACALILSGRDVCLVRRLRPAGDQYTLPGGIVEPGEDGLAALARELEEELGLDIRALPEEPKLRWIQEQCTTRRGASEPFRRRHLIHTLQLPEYLRRRISATEQDAEDMGFVVWVDRTEAADLHLYPPVGEAIAELPSRPSGTMILPAVTDATYTWR